jgi:hypothetical protein
MHALFSKANAVIDQRDFRMKARQNLLARDPADA